MAAPDRPPPRRVRGPVALLIIAAVLALAAFVLYAILRDTIASRGKAPPLTTPSAAAAEAAKTEAAKAAPAATVPSPSDSGTPPR